MSLTLDGGFRCAIHTLTIHNSPTHPLYSTGRADSAAAAGAAREERGAARPGGRVRERQAGLPEDVRTHDGSGANPLCLLARRLHDHMALLVPVLTHSPALPQSPHSIRDLTRESALYRTMAMAAYRRGDVDLIARTASFDENRGVWILPNFALPMNLPNLPGTGGAGYASGLRNTLGSAGNTSAGATFASPTHSGGGSGFPSTARRPETGAALPPSQIPIFAGSRSGGRPVTLGGGEAHERSNQFSSRGRADTSILNPMPVGARADANWKRSVRTGYADSSHHGGGGTPPIHNTGPGLPVSPSPPAEPPTSARRPGHYTRPQHSAGGIGVRDSTTPISSREGVFSPSSSGGVDIGGGGGVDGGLSTHASSLAASASFTSDFPFAPGSRISATESRTRQGDRMPSRGAPALSTSSAAGATSSAASSVPTFVAQGVELSALDTLPRRAGFEPARGAADDAGLGNGGGAGGASLADSLSTALDSVRSRAVFEPSPAGGAGTVGGRSPSTDVGAGAGMLNLPPRAPFQPAPVPGSGAAIGVGGRPAGARPMAVPGASTSSSPSLSGKPATPDMSLLGGLDMLPRRAGFEAAIPSDSSASSSSSLSSTKQGDPSTSQLMNALSMSMQRRPGFQPAGS